MYFRYVYSIFGYTEHHQRPLSKAQVIRSRSLTKTCQSRLRPFYDRNAVNINEDFIVFRCCTKNKILEWNSSTAFLPSRSKQRLQAAKDTSGLQAPGAPVHPNVAVLPKPEQSFAP